jgi:hypothetical protein
VRKCISHEGPLSKQGVCADYSRCQAKQGRADEDEAGIEAPLKSIDRNDLSKSGKLKAGIE